MKKKLNFGDDFGGTMIGSGHLHEGGWRSQSKLPWFHGLRSHQRWGMPEFFLFEKQFCWPLGVLNFWTLWIIELFVHVSANFVDDFSGIKTSSPFRRNPRSLKTSEGCGYVFTHCRGWQPPVGVYLNVLGVQVSFGRLWSSFSARTCWLLYGPSFDWSKRWLSNLCCLCVIRFLPCQGWFQISHVQFRRYDEGCRHRTNLSELNWTMQMVWQFLLVDLCHALGGCPDASV